MPDAVRPIVVVPKKRGWGCFGCGCAILVLIVLLLLGLALLGGRKAYQVARGFTGSQPAPIVTADAGPAVYDGAERKLNDFEQAVAREQPATLHFSSDEINTLIARDPAFAQARGHLAVTLQGQTASLQTNIPLGQFEKAFLTDRYLNADATFGLSFDPGTGRLLFDVQSLTLNGQPLPSGSNAGLDQTINQVVNQQMQANQLARDFLARVNKADIENGELVIETK